MTRTRTLFGGPLETTRPLPGSLAAVNTPVSDRHDETADSTLRGSHLPVRHCPAQVGDPPIAVVPALLSPWIRGARRAARALLPGHALAFGGYSHRWGG